MSLTTERVDLHTGLTILVSRVRVALGTSLMWSGAANWAPEVFFSPFPRFCVLIWPCFVFNLLNLPNTHTIQWNWSFSEQYRLPFTSTQRFYWEIVLLHVENLMSWPITYDLCTSSVATAGFRKIYQETCKRLIEITDNNISGIFHRQLSRAFWLGGHIYL